MKRSIIRRLASRLFGATVLDRVVDPTFADIDKERADALCHGRLWLARGVTAAGYLGLAKALALYGVERAVRTPFELLPDERRLVGRTIAWVVLWITALTVILTLLPLVDVPRVPALFRTTYLIALVPQALPLAIPMGLTLGIAVALNGRRVTAKSKNTILSIAAICAVISFATFAWIMPRANQAFRTAIFQDAGRVGAPLKGAAELTMSELKDAIVLANRLGEPREAQRLAIMWHRHWAIPFAPVFLAAFALALANQFQKVGRMRLIAIVCLVFTGYYVALYGGEYLVKNDTLPPFAGAWLPNALVLLSRRIV